MWTQWKNVDADGENVKRACNEQMGDIYGIEKRDQTTEIKVSSVVPLLKLVASRGVPMRLRLRIKPSVKVREQKDNKALPSSKAPNKSCPSVTKQNKHKLLIT